MAQTVCTFCLCLQFNAFYVHFFLLHLNEWFGMSERVSSRALTAAEAAAAVVFTICSQHDEKIMIQGLQGFVKR